MNKSENEILQFWEYNDKGVAKILNTKLLGFLESQGFANAKLSETKNILVKKQNNRMSIASEANVDQTIKEHLLRNKEYDIYEVFARGMGGYVSPRKFNLLNIVELVNDRDTFESSKFFFKNCFCEVSREEIKIDPYENLATPIWENRILNISFNRSSNDKIGQFEQFCKNITGNSEVRFQGLKTILGYLLHRNKEVGDPKAIILYDEKMGQNKQAHGGTGKTLLSQALAKCRELEIFDGKEIKTGSWFKNQRVEIITDVLVYDDLNSAMSLENFYSMITSGIEVEKKGRQAFYIDYLDSPKILITSNYPVKGPGGSSDERRRHEFELSNYYNADFTPENEFGNRFFGNAWDNEEWSKFYLFMMSCVQEYLTHGLVQVDAINLNKAKIKSDTSEEFVNFAEEFVTLGSWQDKREFENAFRELHPENSYISSHIIKKWLDAFALDKGKTVELKSTAGAYFFKIGKEAHNA